MRSVVSATSGRLPPPLLPLPPLADDALLPLEAEPAEAANETLHKKKHNRLTAIKTFMKQIIKVINTGVITAYSLF